MTELYKPSKDILKRSHITRKTYEAEYERSLNDPDGFWRDMAARLDWVKPPTKIKNTRFSAPVSIKWYEDGILNACYNCVDRHAAKNGKATALIFEGNNPDEVRRITFAELKDEVSKLANALKSRSIKKGDRVAIYMPMVPEAVFAMLACARIGAIHSVVFGGFSAESLKNRIMDCGAHIVITADEAYRGEKIIPLKANVDKAVENLINVHTVLVLRRTGGDVSWNAPRDVWWHDLVDLQSTHAPCEPMNAEDPLFILYTSGSTGKPKGVMHTTGGYLVYVSLTHEWVFDYKPGEVYWCTADVGWVTGHSYSVYGPLCNGAITLVFEGIPTYPDASRFWQVVDKHAVNIFYTAPTAIRSLLAQKDDFVKRTSRKSLRVLGSVGEPINHEAWLWFYEVVGEKYCPIMDTWWQTETGGHIITPLVCFDLKPGSAMKPFFGINAVLLDAQGKEIIGEGEGALCFSDSWPGQMRGVYADAKRFEETYFQAFPGYYASGDGARRDADGDYWITGRTDDIIKVSGHRLGTAEIENAINHHPQVAESAVVGTPHKIKGESLYAFVILKNKWSDETKREIIREIDAIVRRDLGPIASIDKIQFVAGLPKTRSGKIMRRILRKIASGVFDDLGDTSTLADPGVVAGLIAGRQENL